MGRSPAVAALALFAAILLSPAAVQAQEYNRGLRSQDVVLERSGSDGGWMISGRVAMDVQTTLARNLSFQLLLRVNGRPIDTVSPAAYGWTQRLIFGLGVPGGAGGGVSCVSFCSTYCQNGACNYYQYSNVMCMCANNEAGANIYIPSRFSAPLPQLRPGDEVMLWVLPLAGSLALPEIRTDDDVLVMIVPPCTVPTITHQPASRGLCPTDSGLFTVDASGTAPTFRWQWQPGGVGTAFVNIPQGTINNADGRPCFIVDGVSTASLRITRILDEQYHKGINLRCAVQNACGSATSNPAVFDMLAKPLISTQPQSTTACASGEAFFSVEDTSGNPTPSTFQWQWRTIGTADWVNMIDGLNTDPATGEPTFTATGSRQIIAGTTSIAGSGGPRREFRVVVTNSCGSVNSNPATVTICTGDFNCDGGVDGDDVGAFFSRWENGDAAADTNADGGVDGADVGVFFEHWEAGC